jgi:hypothetical protein
MADPSSTRRRMYAAPFGALQTNAPSIQYGNGSIGPTQGGINALAAQGINPIASPFGSVPTAGPTPDPPAPGFNVEVGTPTPMGWVPTRLGSILGAALTPTREGVAATMGAPVDAATWAARRMGVTVPENVPGSSQYFQNLMANPPHAEINALLRALRRY